MSSAGSDTEVALEKFEQWLVRYHDGAADFEGFCREHPEHEARFRTWWQRLVDASEIGAESRPCTRGRSTTGPLSSVDGEADIDDETGLPLEGSTFGSYALEVELGRGSQGTVFLATDMRLGRKVALKILPAVRMPGSSRSKRFAREAELASRLDHPGLCSVYERGSLRGAAFLAMRYVEGETLAARILHERRLAARDEGKRRDPKRGRALPMPDLSAAKGEGERIRLILSLFEQVCDAMSVAHDARLVHRDIKPGNLIVDPSGRPVVLDFGLARHVEEDALTITGDLVGTPAYMSPEQIAAKRIDVDHRSDIYSLGATLFECLTLRRPFEAPTRQELYQQILTAEAPNARKINPEIPKELAIVLSAALEKDRRRRYQTMRDFGEDLMRVRTLQPIRARSASPLLRARRWVQRNSTIAASLAFVILVLSAALAFSLASLAERNRAQASVSRLRLRTKLDRAEELARELLTVEDPARRASPERERALRDWIRDHGQVLADARPDLEDCLARLHARALPEDKEATAKYQREHALWKRRVRLINELEGYRGTFDTMDPDRMTTDFLSYAIEEHEAKIRACSIAISELRPWRFQSDEEAVSHAGLVPLVEDLRAFLAEDGLLALCRAEAERIATLRELTSEQREAWKAVAARIAQNERYATRKLAPQTDLIPLGADPVSGLEEFAIASSGRAPARGPKGVLEVTDDAAIVLVLLPGGRFDMGSANGPEFERSIAGVELERFFASKYELTFGQWRRIGGSQDVEGLPISQRMLVNFSGPSHPLHGMTYARMRMRIRRQGLDVPTEAQWEYAARGGRRGFPYARWVVDGDPVANIRDASFVREGLNRRPMLRAYDDGVALTAVVGSFPANDFGLHDVIGNVHEFTRESHYAVPLRHFKRDARDGFHHVPDSGFHGARGGAYESARNEALLTSRRQRFHHNWPWRGVGVRPVRRVED